jgi:serine/threonine protein kinase
VKPGNFMVDRTGTVKVLDLGLALLTNDEQTQLTRAVLGSVDYLAPEQGMDSHAVDARADVYGLGATFWFLLTGTTPFSGVSLAERALAHRTGKLRPLNSLCPGAPPGLEAIIVKMMAKDPDQRYTSAAEVAEALAPFIAQPVDLPSEAEMPRLSRATRNAISPDSITAPSERAASASPSAASRKLPAESRRTPKGVRTVALKSVSPSRTLAREVSVERPDHDDARIQNTENIRRGIWRLFAPAAKALADLLRYAGRLRRR